MREGKFGLNQDWLFIQMAPIVIIFVHCIVCSVCIVHFYRNNVTNCRYRSVNNVNWLNTPHYHILCAVCESKLNFYFTCFCLRETLIIANCELRCSNVSLFTCENIILQRIDLFFPAVLFRSTQSHCFTTDWIFMIRFRFESNDCNVSNVDFALRMLWQTKANGSRSK